MHTKSFNLTTLNKGRSLMVVKQWIDVIEAVFFVFFLRNYSVGCAVGSREETLVRGRLVKRLLQKTSCEMLKVSSWGSCREKQVLEGRSRPPGSILYSWN